MEVEHALEKLSHILLYLNILLISYFNFCLNEIKLQF